MKYNRGFAPLILVAIIVGALVIGGGAYYLGKSKGEDKKVGENVNVENQGTDNSENTKGVDQVNKNIEKKGIKTQVNANAGYQVEYPSDWYVKSSDTTISGGHNSFNILNTKDAVLPGSDFTLKANGSYINISVNTNMNYSNYEEFIKDPKTDLPKLAKDERIANLKIINIGGKTLQGLNSFKNGISGGSYVFIYNKKLFDIGISSGSEEQFTKDKKVFEDMVSSFKFLDSEESSVTKNDVTNQPAYLKSVYVKDGKNYIDVDYVQMFATSDERIKAMIEDKVCLNAKDCYDFPNGYKRNANPLIRTFEVSSSVLINVYGMVGNTLFNSNTIENPSISLSKFSSTISQKNIKNDYVKIDVKDGKVVKIVEPYQE